MRHLENENRGRKENPKGICGSFTFDWNRHAVHKVNAKSKESDLFQPKMPYEFKPNYAK